MKHCYECGTKLIIKECQDEGLTPYCPDCKMFRFPIFNCAISAVIISPDRCKVCLIQQYGKPDNILVAGYIEKGESAERTLEREVKEELGLKLTHYRYRSSHYFNSTNTLMLSFECYAESEKLHYRAPEIDYAQWFPLEQALAAIKPKSLAEKFLIQVITDLM